MTEDDLNNIARQVAPIVADQLPVGVGFALMVFDFGDKGSFAWISNADRDDMLLALREFIQKAGH